MKKFELNLPSVSSGAHRLPAVRTQLFHSVSNLFVGFTLQANDFLQVIFWRNLLIGAFIIPFIAVAKPKLNYPRKGIFQFFIATYMGAVGALLLFRAFEENLTISSSIALMSSPIVFVISLFTSWFKPDLLERHTLKVYFVRSIGIILILFGVFRLSAS